jgi:DNA repair exonuclease SbcCD ATPase subunit
MIKKIKMGDVKSLFEKYGDLNLKVKTPYGYKKIVNCEVTEKDGDVHKIKTENNLFLYCSKHHRVKTKNGRFCFIKDIVPGQIIKTEYGNSPVLSIENIGIKKDLIDIQVEDVEQYYSNGILSHNSTLSVDLLQFLFFNSTTKTSVNLDVFNTYRDVDTVWVKGYLTIDGNRYIIERTVTRKKSKLGEYSATSKLEYSKLNVDGSIENFEGEQRRETEKFITSAIGTEEDFLATILTTGKNLEDLIDSKPTARGAILTRFLGLESLKEKEEICKSIQSEWSKKLVSNSYNIVTLETTNETNKNLIDEHNKTIKKLGEDLVTFEVNLGEIEKRRDEVMLTRNNDIDQELIRTNPALVQKEIEELKIVQSRSKESGVLVTVTEPSQYYMEEDHEKIKTQVNDVNLELRLNANSIVQNEKLVEQMEKGDICPTCKRPFTEVDHSGEIIELKNVIQKLRDGHILIIGKQNEILAKEMVFSTIKKELDEYEKNKLRKAKYELEVEQKQLEIDQKQARLDRYESNRNKLEMNQKIDAEIIALKTKIDTANADIRVTKSTIDRLKNTIITLNDAIKINLELITKIKAEEEVAGVFKTYMTIYGKNGISKVIMKNMIPLLNQELSRLLSDSSYFTLEMNINDKNELEFLMIDNETRVVKPLKSGSGYEKTIAALALRGVLTKISSLPKPNIVVMDEVFGKVADENLELIGEFFKKIKMYFEHIFVISHNPLIRNWSDNIIMVKKEENISSIENITTKIQ